MSRKLCFTCLWKSSFHLPQIRNGKMQVPESVRLHNTIGGFTTFLSWIGQAAGIDDPNPFFFRNGGLVGMPIADDVDAAGYGLLHKIIRAHGDIIGMAMRHPNLVFINEKLQFPRQLRKEIIVSRHHLDRTGHRLRQGILAPLNVAAMNHHVRAVHRHDLKIIFIPSMGVTHNNDLHLCSPFLNRYAILMLHFAFINRQVLINLAKLFLHEAQRLTSMADLILLLLREFSRMLSVGGIKENGIIAKTVAALLFITDSALNCGLRNDFTPIRKLCGNGTGKARRPSRVADAPCPELRPCTARSSEDRPAGCAAEGKYARRRQGEIPPRRARLRGMRAQAPQAYTGAQSPASKGPCLPSFLPVFIR